jgi:hypothetical protein
MSAVFPSSATLHIRAEGAPLPHRLLVLVRQRLRVFCACLAQLLHGLDDGCL